MTRNVRVAVVASAQIFGGFQNLPPPQSLDFSAFFGLSHLLPPRPFYSHIFDTDLVTSHYGKKYCHSSPTLDEAPLQQAIIAALNTVLPNLDGRIRQITEALEAEVIPFPNSGMSLGDIDRRLAELEAQFQRLLEKAADDPIACGDQFKEILDEQTSLKELRATILAESREHAEADRRIKDAAGMLENAVSHITEWDETAIRQLVAQVKVLSKNEISVTLKSGIEIRQSISN